jgi:ABC-type antimicrobial peptide transport system permease subunit
VLSVAGVYGVVSYTTSRRTQEIGVRMALGARSRDILELILKEGAALAAGGIALGAALAYGAGRTLEALLVGIGPGDAASFLTAVTVTAVMTLAGSLLPALRAVRVDPITAMRSE